MKSKLISLSMLSPLLAIYILFLLPQNFNPVMAQGDIFCSSSFNCTMTSNNCADGASPPCESGDCCNQFYNENGVCPVLIPCEWDSENNPPDTNNDSYSTEQDTELNVSAANGVLANDSDPDGDSLTAVLNPNVEPQGSVGLNSNGSFTYNPPSGFTGTDVFTYYAYDGTDNSIQTSVSITVSEDEPPPQECTAGDPANCDSGAGCFQCEWHEGGIGCMANISEGWMCNANHGHRDSVCQQFDNRDDCLECGVNLLCQEENEAVGYRCEGTTFGCYPCFQDDVDNGISGCSPEPEYDNSDDCEDACSGATQTTYACIDGECVESGSSDMPLYQCLTECSTAPNPLGAGTCSGDDGIYTAIGCIPISGDTEFVSFFLGWAIGIAGGIALILIVYAGIQIITAGGNPKRIQSGKELLTAAIGGFLFLLFSVYLLEFIGIDILDIPGF